ncbi:hypothetical protein Tco_0131597, partial [Tanacetum coccineum]
MCSSEELRMKLVESVSPKLNRSLQPIKDDSQDKFEEIQALYEKIKRSDEDFISIGSAKDERLIKKMNEKGIDISKKKEVKEESKEEVHEESKEEESKRTRENLVLRKR